MRKYLMTATLLAGLGATGMAFAGDDCRVPKADWQPREAVQAMAEAQGWTVRRIKTDDGCYEVKGRDAQGRQIEAKLDPATLKVVEIEYDDDDDDDDDGARPVAPAGAAQPPANGLFTPGSKPVVE